MPVFLTMKHGLGNLGRLLVLGVMAALVIVAGTTSGQVSGGTFDKKTRGYSAAVTWPD